MAKFQEHRVTLGDGRYGAPSVTIRRVDFSFGKIPLHDPRVSPYLDVDVPSKVDNDRADVILHCVKHDTFADGVSWNGSASVAERPNLWCSECARMKTGHALIETEREAASQARQDAHESRYPVAQRWNESEAAYAERLAHVKSMTRRSYSQDIEVAIRTLAKQPQATGKDVLAAMIDTRYGTQERETLEAIVARRRRLGRRRRTGADSPTA